ncbi:hypothetical protein RJ640_001822 [Escallonia rubra]|uniref:Uncharacterized protein n=1 Tax=Escallonia rubra TaxID=112253 RepID=A0AA88QSL4_9ASTE|nr:hypothetical protein RJ640_001822 [Escallonia rubra]
MVIFERLGDFKQRERPRSLRHERAKDGGDGKSKSGSPKAIDDERSGDKVRRRHHKEEKKHEGSRKHGNSRDHKARVGPRRGCFYYVGPHYRKDCPHKGKMIVFLEKHKYSKGDSSSSDRVARMRALQMPKATIISAQLVIGYFHDQHLHEHETATPTWDLSGHVVELNLQNPNGDCNSFDDLYAERVCEKNKLSGKINPSLLNLEHLSYLNLRHNRFSGSLPHGDCNSFDDLYAERVCEKNKLSGKINPSWLNLEHLSYLDLSHNRFSGSLPRLPPNVFELDLSNNSFIGNLSHFLCGNTNKPKQLEILILGDNLLSGDIPDCWMSWASLRVVALGNNNLKGNIPSSMGYLSDLRSLHLRNNSLNGEAPMALQNCTELMIIDLSENEFCGSVVGIGF